MSEQIASHHPGTASDYDRIGGGPTVRSVVEAFYDRVLADPRLVEFFAEVDMPRLKRHQAQLISHALGGPVDYEGRELRSAHAGLAIRKDHFAAVVDHLVAVLRVAAVPADIVGRVVDTLAATEHDIVATKD